MKVYVKMCLEAGKTIEIDKSNVASLLKIVGKEVEKDYLNYDFKHKNICVFLNAKDSKKPLPNFWIVSADDIRLSLFTGNAVFYKLDYHSNIVSLEEEDIKFIEDYLNSKQVTPIEMLLITNGITPVSRWK